ncbi:hypothetical protein [Paenibacillus sp. PL91]|uniref:hypothetical protein n=1 Tax=Paenibacillus sp. PL91 TaxID=2729538 RepID=UPI00145F1F7E|nr:hypothetical protein [Paenibacillus sp. PL91]MBC9201460.1 hypothetical protein [Paenibacillus sp. PL91]
MTYSEKQIAAKWIDDYLDLYNFAVKIGDADWQQQILQNLHNKDNHIRLEIEHGIRVDLWLRFDNINRKMLEIYEQLRSAQHSEQQQQQLREKVWEFKQQRVMIASKLKAHYAL